MVTRGLWNKKQMETSSQHCRAAHLLRLSMMPSLRLDAKAKLGLMRSLSGETSGGLGNDDRCITMLVTSDRNQHSEVSEVFVKLSSCLKRVTPCSTFLAGASSTLLTLFQDVFDATVWVARICCGFNASVVFKH